MNTRKAGLILLSCLLLINAFAQKEQAVESSISDVTLFLNKAQITRAVKYSLLPGRTDLILTGLTPNLDPQSIQVSGKGNLIILGTSHRINYLAEQSRSVSLQRLQDSAALCQKTIQTQQNGKAVLDREEQMLMANQKISGNNLNLTVAELKAMSDFFRSRLTDISGSRAKADDQIRIWNDRLAKINRQIQEQDELGRRNTSEIVVSLQSEKGGPAQLEINYIAGNAGWNPVYDIRSAGTRESISVDYKANVYQATGENWDNVQLTLSTANPNLGGVKPDLQQWSLDIQEPVRAMAAPVRKREMMMRTDQMAAAAPVEMENAQSLAEMVTVVQTTLNVEFKIALPQTVHSASKPVLVDIRKSTVPASYEYSVVPKLDKDAFLMARITGWESLNLLNGEANIYFEGTFVGKTTIDPNALNDTLSISLGRDKRIIVEREKIKDLSSRKVIGTSRRETASWQISVRNAKAESVRIVVEDQLPVSRNSQIEVLNTDTGGGKLNTVTGKLEWPLTVAPGETKKVTFRYEVKFPKDRLVNGL